MNLHFAFKKHPIKQALVIGCALSFTTLSYFTTAETLDGSSKISSNNCYTATKRYDVGKSWVVNELDVKSCQLAASKAEKNFLTTYPNAQTTYSLECASRICLPYAPIKDEINIPSFDFSNNTLNIPVLAFKEMEGAHLDLDLQLNFGDSKFNIAKIKEKPYTQYKNPNNPLDWIGEIHNQGVHYALSRIQEMPADKVNETLLNNLVKGSVNDSSDMKISASPIQKDELVKTLLESKQISGDGAKIVTELLNLIESSRDISKLQRAITKLESKASTLLSEKELSMFYGASSIARHSAALWSSNVSKPLPVELVGIVIIWDVIEYIKRTFIHNMLVSVEYSIYSSLYVFLFRTI
jgi:hypothetical protein